MKKIPVIILGILLLLVNTNTMEMSGKFHIDKINVYEENTVLIQNPGEYVSTDGKKIIVAEDNSILYENTYSLTTTSAPTGNTLSGKIGTNKKSATFYQLNSSTIVSETTVTYTHNSVTNYLNENTIFYLSKTPVASEIGNYHVYRNNQLVNKYATFQDAVNAANENDTIKLSTNIKVTEGAYINKNLTIDGNNIIVDNSSWSNSFLVIEEGKTVNIKNLTIDGKSNFEIDYNQEEPVLKSESITNSPISKKAIILSHGNINMDKVVIKNNYFTTSQPTLKIIRGNAKITNSTFHHNYNVEKAVAIQVGSKLRNGETTFPVKNFEIDNCNVTENFSAGGSGGAIIVNFTENVKITNTNFVKNVASTTSSGGGAIYFEASSVSIAEANNLEYIQASFDNCLFEQNYCGNDGLAISSDSAELTITNSKFINNRGTGGTNCVGTVSCMLNGNREYDVIIKDTIFKNNFSEGVSVFGDHGTLANVLMENVQLEENIGNISVLLYSGQATFKNVNAVNERVNTTVFDIRPYRNVSNYPLYKPQFINFSNVNVIDTNGPTDILLRKYNRNTSYNPATAVIKDKVVANVDLWDNTSYLNVEGTLIGNVNTDQLTSKDNVTVLESGKLNGTIIEHPNTYVVTLTYPLNDINKTKFLYLEQNKEYSYKELYQYHKTSKDNYKLEFYTNQDYTTVWDRKVTGPLTIYPKYIEHQHSYDTKPVVIDNKIYVQCECGHPQLKLAIKVSEENQYTGKPAIVNIIGDSTINNYELKYYSKSGNTWSLLKSAPKNVGTYKVVLNYNGHSIEEIYKIQNEIFNPETSTNNVITAIILVLLMGFVLNISIKKYNKEAE